MNQLQSGAMPETVTFKSAGQYYWREVTDNKNNTFRKVDLADERFSKLQNYQGRLLNRGELLIEIEHKENPKNSFVRSVRDVSFMDGYCILTWYEEKVI
jgi:hypothetical protein